MAAPTSMVPCVQPCARCRAQPAYLIGRDPSPDMVYEVLCKQCAQSIVLPHIFQNSPWGPIDHAMSSGAGPGQRLLYGTPCFFKWLQIVDRVVIDLDDAGEDGRAGAAASDTTTRPPE